MNGAALPLLYTELAGWFHLLTAPHEYVEEARDFKDAFQAAIEGPQKTLLELGAGGGNNAFHLKRDFECLLTDLSPHMLECSMRLNPECPHQVGDLRTLRLLRAFDAVLVHDAICYMTTERDLSRALESAYVHTRPGGVAIFAPDCMKESFTPGTDCGGNDEGTRAVRYLEWWWDPDPADDTYVCDYAFMIRDEHDRVRVVVDRHVEGVFARATWVALCEGLGFVVSSGKRVLEDEGEFPFFVCKRPLRPGATKGEALSFADFLALTTEAAYRDEVLPLLNEWFGAAPSDPSFTLYSLADGNDATGFELHREIQRSAERRSRLYQLAMGLWR